MSICQRACRLDIAPLWRNKCRIEYAKRVQWRTCQSLFRPLPPRRQCRPSSFFLSIVFFPQSLFFSLSLSPSFPFYFIPILLDDGAVKSAAV